MNSTAPHAGRAGHPIFARLHDEGRHQLWLARKTGFSHAHVRGIKSGLQAPGPRFREACARLFGCPESELFHDGSSRSRPRGDSDARAVTALEQPTYAIEEAPSIRQTA